jgi:serine/threonine protein kinase
MVGKTIAHYEVLDELRGGGMGVVYRALDTRLGREVAVKALPEELSAHPERLARFDREAKTLASLNHPNVGAIYGLEKAEDRQFLILDHSLLGQQLPDGGCRGDGRGSQRGHAR